jgi:hypothetical protein
MSEGSELNVYRILSAVFGVLGLAIMVKVILARPFEYAVGESFIMDELTLPTPFYTFHFKPITLFTILGFLYWTLGLEGFRNYFVKFPRVVKRLIIIFLATAAFVMMYEFIQNFFMWTSFYIMYGGDLDKLYHQINPAMPKPVNFNFISKMFAMFFAGSLYGLHFFMRMEKATNNVIKG